jgi:hypothetical protein
VNKVRSEKYEVVVQLLSARPRKPRLNSSLLPCVSLGRMKRQSQPRISRMQKDCTDKISEAFQFLSVPIRVIRG